MATESRGVLNELQIRSNLHNPFGIARTKRNQSAQDHGRPLFQLSPEHTPPGRPAASALSQEN
jgi:hypothetical protein